MTFDRSGVAGWVVLAALGGVLAWGGVRLIAGGGAQRAQTPSSAIPPAAGKPGSRLNRPDVSFRVLGPLGEISGVSASADPKALWAVNDEQGKAFRLSTANGEVLDEITFGAAGDYEAVAEVDGVLYVGRSDGVLFLIDPTTQKAVQQNLTKALGPTCDLEGLGYQKEQLRLLLACKGGRDGAFVVHAMNLLTRTMQAEPAYTVAAKDIDAFIAAHPESPGLQRLAGKRFSPSDVAVHPKTGDVHLVSSTGEMVVVLDRKGTLTQVFALDREVHPQPEGITFQEDGTLFISNESRGKPAVIHKYNPGADAS